MMIDLPTVRVDDEVVKVVSGQHVKLGCSVEAFPPPVTSWSLSNRAITSGQWCWWEDLSLFPLSDTITFSAVVINSAKSLNRPLTGFWDQVVWNCTTPAVQLIKLPKTFKRAIKYEKLICNNVCAGGRYKIYSEERQGFVDTSLIIQHVSRKDHMTR